MRPPAVLTLDPAYGLPILDLAALAEAGATPEAASLRPMARGLDAACKEFGGCYLANHGLPATLLEAAFAALLGDPAATTPLAGGSNGEPARLVQGPGPGDLAVLWPGQADDAAGAALACAAALRLLAGHVTWLIAVASGLPPGGLDGCFANPTTALHVLHAPPGRAGADDRAGAASGSGFVTLLAHDAGGLQVRTQQGRWIDVAPVAGALVLTLGDLAARWSRGQWPATPYRVISRGSRDRPALAFRYDPPSDGGFAGTAQGDNPRRESADV